MAELKTAHTPELKGLYANSNRFTQPQGTVPRLSNLYMIRRGAFHTTPGSKWISSFDGAAPHVTNQQPIVAIKWYSPSAGSSADRYMTSISAPSITPHHFVLILQDAAGPSVNLTNASGTTFQVIANQSGAVSPLSNAAQIGDYLAIALGFDLPPDLFPLYSQVTLALVPGGATTVDVLSTLPFPAHGFIKIDAEIFSYTGITQTSFTGLNGGQFGTGAAVHNPGASVTYVNGAGATQVLAPITNTFDPSLVYVQWPGTIAGGASTSVAVNIGTVIFVVDGAGVSWLFRAQNSGVTAFGDHYPGPQFFPNGVIGGGFGTDGSMHSAVNILTTTQSELRSSMVGLPITVAGAGPGGGPLAASVTGFISANQISLSVNASVTVSGAHWVCGTGQFGDTAKDFNPENNSGTVVWLNIGQAALSPPGAAYVFQHLNNLYLWGVGSTYGPDGITGPDALWQSDNGKPTVFNPANVTFVGKGDGTRAQGGAVYSLSEAGIAATPQLVLFKDASTYSFLNSFPLSESLVQVSGGLGCIAPDTIQFIGGYGVMRLSYAGVTLFDGQLEHVTEYTDAIRGYLFGTIPGVQPVDFDSIQSCVSTQCVNPPLYIFYAPVQGHNGQVTRAFGYDFGLKQWFVQDLPFPISAAAFIPQSVVALSAKDQSLVAGLQDGAVRRVFAGDPDWDGTAIAWSTQLPDYGFAGTPTYIRRTNVAITADGGGAAPALTNVFFQGIRRSSKAFVRRLNLPRSIYSTLDVGETVLSGNITIAGVGQVLIEGSDAQTSDKPMSRIGL